MSKYRCPSCRKTMKRGGNAPRHRSYCEATGKMVWMKKLKEKK